MDGWMDGSIDKLHVDDDILSDGRSYRDWSGLARERWRERWREKETERGKSRADDESSKRNKRARLVPTRRVVSDPPLEP